MVKTASVDSAERLCAVLEQSRLLNGEALAKAKQLAAEGGDTKSVARRWVRQGLLTAWQAGQLIGGRTDLHIGKYKLVDQLGEVGLGRVYLAQHVQMDRRVALKLLSRRHSNSESVQRFLSHVRELAGIDHPHIIRAYDVDRHDDRYYLVMEYVAGKTLEKQIQDGGLATVDTAVAYVQQIADALACSHKRGVPHGDLKPANVIIDEENQVKVLNLGIATLRDETGEGDTSQSSADSGGFPFPKHLLGQERVVERFDLFALGATFAYLLTGKKDLGSSREIAGTLQRLRPEVPESLAQMCQKLMLCEAETQPSAESCAALLAQWQKEHGAKAAAPKKGVETDPRGAAPAKRGEEGASPPKKIPAAAPPRKKPAPAAAVAAAPGPVDAEHESPGGFKIDLNRPPLTPVAPVAPVVAVVASDGTVAPAAGAVNSGAPSVGVPLPPAAPAAASPMMGILLAAGMGAVVLLGAIYGIYVWMNSAPATPVAAVDPAKGKDEKLGENPGTGKSGETTPGTKGEEKKGEEKKGEEKKGEDPKPEPPKPVQPETKPEGTPPEKQPDPPMPAPLPPKPVDPPMPAPLPMPEPMPPKPVDPPLPVPMPPKPADPPARAKALRDFPDTVELPAIAKGMAPVPMVLGKIDIQEGDTVVINLLGGEKANGRGKQQFRLAARNNGLSENEWDLKLGGALPSAGEGSDTDIAIAKLSVAEGGLKFEWTPEGLADDTSNYVRNCALGIRVGGDEKNVALRKPAEIETFLLIFDKPIPKKELKKVDHLPDLSLVRLEVLPIEGLPEHRIEPTEVPLDNGLIDIIFGKGEKEVFKITLDSKVVNKRIPTIGLTTMRAMPGPQGIGAGVNWSKFSVSAVGKEIQGLQAQNVVLGNQSTGIGKALNQLPAQQKQVATQQKANLDYAIEQNDELIKRLGMLNEQLAAIHEKGQIVFQLVYPAGDCRVVLAKSVPGLNPEKPTRGPKGPAVPNMPPIGGGVEGLPGLNLERQK